jgi:hypothetical protein
VTIHDGSAVDLGDLVVDVGVTVRGRMLDSRGLPIAQVSVMRDASVHPMSEAKTGQDGRFELENCARERQRLRFRCEGYSDSSREIDPTSPAPVEVVLRHPAVFKGVIAWPAGSPSRRTSIELLRPGAERGPYEESELLVVPKAGHFKQEVAAGKWVGVWTDDEGTEHTVGEWDLPEGGTLEVKISLPAK